MATLPVEQSRGEKHRRRSRSGSSSRASSAPVESKAAARHWTLLDLSVVLVAFAIPLIMGGREPYGWMALAILGPLAASLWCLRQLVTDEPTPLAWSWMYVPVAIATGLMVLQLTPLSEGMLTSLSPKLGSLLPLSETGGVLPAWKLLTVSPHESRTGLILFLATAMVFAMTYQHMRDTNDSWRMLGIVCAATIGMALFALVQFFTTNGLFFWCYEHHFGTARDVVKGTFTNRNNFAHFMAIGIGPALAWMCRWNRLRDEADGPGPQAPGHAATWQRSPSGPGLSVETIMSLVMMVSAAVMAFSAFRSLSRMGTIATGVAVLTFLIAGGIARVVSSKLILSGIIGCAVVASAMVVFKPETIGLDEKIETAMGGDLDEIDGEDGRRKLWNALTEVVGDYPLVGTGMGSHREIYPSYLAMKDGEGEYTHAESGYFQIAVELGLPGLLSAIMALLLVVLACVWLIRANQPDHRLLGVAVLSATIATALHAVTDFAWYAPGNTIILAILAAIALRSTSFTCASTPNIETTTAVAAGPHLLPGFNLPQWMYAAPLCLALFLGGYWTWQLTPVVQAYSHFRQFQLLIFRPRPDIDPQDAKKLKLRHILAAAKLDPQDGRYAVLASLHLKQAFTELQQQDAENSMPISQLRETAYVGGFQTVPELREWLERAVGPQLKYLDASHQLARRAAMSLPLQGTAYLQMHELGFLRGLPKDQCEQLLDRGLVVRPHAPALHLAKGTSLILAGDAAGGLAHWKLVFPRNAAVRKQVIAMLAPSTPALEFIMQFEPDSKGLNELLAAYTQLNNEAEVAITTEALAKCLAAEAKEATQPIAISKLLSAAHHFWKVNNTEAVRLTIARIEELHPETIAQRRDLGTHYTRLEEWDRAEEHLRWCVDQQPTNAPLLKQYEAVVRAKQTRPRANPSTHSMNQGVIPARHETTSLLPRHN